MRFSGGHPSVADLLPGIVFGGAQNRFTNVVQLPFGQVPKQVRGQNPLWKYWPLRDLKAPTCV